MTIADDADNESFNFLEAPVTTFDTSEGNFVVAEGQREVNQNGVLVTGAFLNPIEEGNFLIISADLTVQNAVAGTQPLLGIANKKAEAQPDRRLPTTEDGNPYSGHSQRVPVEVFGTFFREVPIATGGTTAAIAQSIQPDSAVAHEWEGAGSLNNDTYVVKAGVAEAKAIALFNFGGNF